MNQHGSGAFPSYNTIAQAASLGRSTVIKHIDIASEKGWILKTVRPKGNQDNETNLYGISFPLPSPAGGLGVVHQEYHLVHTVDHPSPFGGPPLVHVVDPNTPVLTPQVTQKIPPNPPRGDESDSSEKKERVKKPRTSLKTFLAACRENGTKPVTGYMPLMDYVRKVALPTEYIEIAWDTFVREHTPGGANEHRLQADWQKHFYNYITKGYYRLWVCKADGKFELTALGLQTRKFLEAA